MQPLPPPLERSGSIYDLGYRPYDGARLGRRYALRTLYIQGLRAAFGLGRRPASKIAPFVLLGLAMLPAVIVLGIAAVGSLDASDTTSPAEYFGFIQIVFALFVAVVGPELVGRDLRHRTLPLYFSRAIARDDYAFSKYAALTTATLGVTVVPQLLIILGNAFATQDLDGYFADNWADVPRTILAGVVVSASVSAVALAIGSQSARRSFTTGGIMALLIVSFIVGNILAETVGRYGLLVSLLDMYSGIFLVVFREAPDPESSLGRNPIPDGIVILVVAAVTLVALAVLIRRYRKVAA